ncbi:sodium ion-translocating decarboxylase subunit beta [Scatolibacter rhodanostii]|uniref:sodium ion-translocating decarboxylase subunit beta n=1 Tax=Scatolibacter rhodanostii TaxID=2014781 RepID=UPI000C06A04B|nr:sodium ion-translocating decarboxylase subunit beta [Scatolibacter rhodanostii]
MKKVTLFLLAAITLLTGCANRDPASVGIIGGADGATSIVVTGKINWFPIVMIAVLLILIIGLVIYFVKKKNNRS